MLFQHHKTHTLTTELQALEESMRQTGVEPATMGLLLFEASVCNVKHSIYKVYKIEGIYVGIWYVREDKSRRNINQPLYRSTTPQ